MTHLVTHPVDVTTSINPNSSCVTLFIGSHDVSDCWPDVEVRPCVRRVSRCCTSSSSSSFAADIGGVLSDPCPLVMFYQQLLLPMLNWWLWQPVLSQNSPADENISWSLNVIVFCYASHNKWCICKQSWPEQQGRSQKFVLGRYKISILIVFHNT